MFYRGLSFCSVDFGLSLASVSFVFSHDARIASSFKRDICCVIASKSPRANLQNAPLFYKDTAFMGKVKREDT